MTFVVDAFDAFLEALVEKYGCIFWTSKGTFFLYVDNEIHSYNVYDTINQYVHSCGEIEYFRKTTRCLHTTLLGKTLPKNQGMMNKWRIILTVYKRNANKIKSFFQKKIKKFYIGSHSC